MSNYRRVSVIHRPLSQNPAIQGVASVLTKPSVWRLSPMHWAILVGDSRTGCRFELCIRNGIMTGFTESHALDGGQYFDLHPDNLGGHTWATNEDIRHEARRIIKKHPLYNSGTSDCQNFVVDLLNRILDNNGSSDLRQQTRSRGINRFVTAATGVLVVGMAGYLARMEYKDRDQEEY